MLVLTTSALSWIWSPLILTPLLTHFYSTGCCSSYFSIADWLFQPQSRDVLLPQSRLFNYTTHNVNTERSTRPCGAPWLSRGSLSLTMYLSTRVVTIVVRDLIFNLSLIAFPIKLPCNSFAPNPNRALRYASKSSKVRSNTLQIICSNKLGWCLLGIWLPKKMVHQIVYQLWDSTTFRIHICNEHDDQTTISSW